MERKIDTYRLIDKQIDRDKWIDRDPITIGTDSSRTFEKAITKLCSQYMAYQDLPFAIQSDKYTYKLISL